MALDLAVQLGHGIRMWGNGFAFRWVALVMFLAFLALIALGVALLWRQWGSGGSATRQDDALNTVRMRYARGEMTREEFLRAHEDLGGGPSPAPPPAPPPSD
jgi:putative membrane protein